MRHLNIFEHYEDKKNAIPLENNLTRVLARIIKDNSYVSESFFRLINNKLLDNNAKSLYENSKEYKYPYEKLDVKLQMTIKNIIDELDLYDDGNKKKQAVSLIGVCLTAENIDWKDQNVGKANSNQIPDIFISQYNGYVFIVEVKKNRIDCQNQLKSYIKALVGDYFDDKNIVSITWDEIIEILEKTKNNNKSGIIVDEYLEYINNHFPNLFDLRKLGDAENSTVIRNRIDFACKNIIKLDNKKLFEKYEEGHLFLKDSKYQQRIEFSISEDCKFIKFRTWLGDIKCQMKRLIDNIKNLEKKNQNQKVELYIKVANCGNWLHNIDLSDDVINILNNYESLYEYCGRSSGKKLEENLNRIIKLSQSSYDLKNDKKMQDYIERKTDKDISVGIRVEDCVEISGYVNFDENFDKNNDCKSDKLALELYKYIKEKLIF